MHLSSEKGEQLNGLLRKNMGKLNRHNPSRDMAFRFAIWYALRYIASGGTWAAGQAETRVSLPLQILRAVQTPLGLAVLGVVEGVTPQIGKF